MILQSKPKLRLNNGFTLVELLTVLVIVGILATIATGYYGRVYEKARTDEAKQALWEVRVAVVQYRLDHRIRDGDPLIGMVDLGLSAVEFPTACRPEKFFKYSFNDTHAIATRCTSSGKPPQGRSAYIVSLDLQNSNWGGTPGY